MQPTARIGQHLDALNEDPVVFTWKYRLDDIVLTDGNLTSESITIPDPAKTQPHTVTHWQLRFAADTSGSSLSLKSGDLARLIRLHSRGHRFELGPRELRQKLVHHRNRLLVVFDDGLVKHAVVAAARLRG